MDGGNEPPHGQRRAPPGISLSVRFSRPRPTEGELGGIDFAESLDEVGDGGGEAEPDNLAAVVDRSDGALAGEFFRLLGQRVPLFPLDGIERFAVGLGDPESVVMELAGEVRLVGGDLDEAPSAVGVEEGLLSAGQSFGHMGAPMEECRLSFGTRVPAVGVQGRAPMAGQTAPETLPLWNRPNHHCV